MNKGNETNDKPVVDSNEPDNEKFLKITGEVISRLEGGYFHPDMRTKQPDKFGAYHRSGETMYGLDRHAGHGLFYNEKRLSDDVIENMKNIYSGKYSYKTPQAREFWKTIDLSNARSKWAWNSIPPEPLKSGLKLVASKIMYKPFLDNANRYLTPQARNIVFNEPRLLFHFSYATWNGSGWFKKFASDINKAVNLGITNPDKLVKIAIASRTNEGLKEGSAPNSLIKQGGKKIEQFINEIRF
ncbi:MAG: hypothetical protein EBR30_21080 [Cytophagia bacterium]|nr:hypothetical protein [Cytophagia bacterium]